MTEISIDPSKTKIAVQVTSQSLHALGFEITVFASDGNIVIEQFNGSTASNKSFVQTLKKKPSEYRGNYIKGIFTVISPDGTDYLYSIIFSIFEDDILVNPNMNLTGTTTKGEKTSIANYHIN
ncbi:MAG: hypothetical protein COZ21_09925 [Bacteroidetes bacterium CG_4_10_14_3_um_filter_31_20]|nr:hypothetical protein [Bacteroidota bacterium]PIX33010.1 MAG: hypothetical protein COZ59_10990 [Bacteroidetes bacterium CG_4_8_14_3_um_filter_31_14]PIY03254.1 MAG: hypothetical protein COZ21_09925 [Bacteroidetes bacterium CG_4_10_14_3_um_filter_31_20]